MRSNVITFGQRARPPRLVASGPGDAAMIDLVIERLRRGEAKAATERRLLDALVLANCPPRDA